MQLWKNRPKFIISDVFHHLARMCAIFNEKNIMIHLKDLFFIVQVTFVGDVFISLLEVALFKFSDLWN